MNFLRKFIVFAVVVVLSGCGFIGTGNVEVGKNRTADSWRLGIMTYTFRAFTFYEAVDKTASLGLGYAEAYIFSQSAGQRLSGEKPNEVFYYSIPEQLKREIKQKLSEANVKLVSCYVAKLPSEETECRKIFGFLKEMGVKAVVSEPPEEMLDLVEKLCKEYEIKLAIHNHPKSSEWSRYWHPDKVLAACKGRSKWIGACADTGHWMRSGVNPVEALKMLEGRVISVHLKDLNDFGVPEAHDVVWGAGKCNVKAVLEELNRQGFEGTIFVEYEHNWEDSLPEIRKCVQYFEQVRRELER